MFWCYIARLLFVVVVVATLVLFLFLAESERKGVVNFVWCGVVLFCCFG